MDKPNILLIDDNPTDLDPLVASFKQSGFKTLVAESGDTVIQKIEDIRPDIILLDVMMPEVDGFETCRRLKGNETTRDIPVIFMAALTETVDKRKGFEVGGADYVTKPFQHEEVLARVNAHLTIRNLQQELQEMNRKLEECQLTDPLTGMRNHRYLLKYIHNDIALAHRDYNLAFRGKTGKRSANSDIVFLLLNLDYFKSVNDIYGHEAGDQVLIQAREILECVCRESDILVHWGKGEFLIVSRYSNQDHAPIIAERLREGFEKHWFELGGGQTIQLTCSIGSASYPFFPACPDYLNWEQVVAIADKGLCAVKQSGRNGYMHIMSTDATQPSRLFQRIQEDVDELIEAGELEIITSLPESKALVF